MICGLRFLPHSHLYLHMIRKSKRSIGAEKYIPMRMKVLFSVFVSSILFFIQQRPTSVISCSAALCSRWSRKVLPSMYHSQCSLWEARSLIQVTLQSIRGSHFLGPASRLLLMLMDWGITQMLSLSSLSFHCVVKPPICSQILIVSATQWLTPKWAFLVLTWTCRVRVWMVSASATTHFCNQNASHYIVGS